MSQPQRLAVHKLARQRGMTYRQFVDSHNALELAEELAFERIDPAPDINRGFARMCSVMVNMWGDGKRQTTSDDFMPPKLYRQRKEQTAEEQVQLLSTIAARPA